MPAVSLNYLIDGPREGAAPAGGEVATVVLGPSLGSTTAMWEPQVAALAERFRVVRYDHRGHGGSPVPDGPYELADLGGDVLALLDTLGVERAHVGGLSLGGMVAMWLGANAPERVDRLALCCTSAKLGPPQMWRDRAAAVRAAGSTSAISEAVVERWFTPEWAAANPGVVADMRAMIESIDPDGYIACCGAIERMDQLDDLARISAPTLVVAGREDPATPPEHAWGIVSRVAGARLSVLDGAAHLANVQHPDVVSRLLVNHFAAT